MLGKITIERFKNINEICLELDKVNVLVGSNNSGKSSILQAVQFAVSAAQTSGIEGARWLAGERLPTSISPNQLIYSPFRDVTALAPNRNLREEREYAILIGFEEAETTNKVEISVRRGRNKNITIELKGKALGTELQKIETPFSIFVPGLAGIPSAEEYKAPSIVRKAAARGDANNVFRNVLYLLKQDDQNWEQFIQDFQFIFPNMNLSVNFNPDRDEFINAMIIINDEILPIDAAGTGVLQAIQILSYINVYKPRVLLLDEPDSHLHPNNQRKVINMLVNLSQIRDFQIILSTHSRHIFDELRGTAKMHWIRNGAIANNEYDELSVLLELGALDKGDLLFMGRMKYVLLTEDTDYNPIKTILEASGFNLSDVDIWPYKGCTNIETARILSSFIRRHAPSTVILLHRDRDYLTDEEAQSFKNRIEQSNIRCFMTKNTDAESHFILPEHINCLYPGINVDRTKEIIDMCTNETKEKSIEGFINSRNNIETSERRRNGLPPPNVGELAGTVRNLYDQNNTRYRKGKLVMGCIKLRLREELGINCNLIKITEYVRDSQLEEIARINS